MFAAWPAPCGQYREVKGCRPVDPRVAFMPWVWVAAAPGPAPAGNRLQSRARHLSPQLIEQLLTLAVSVAVSIVAIKYMRRDSNTIRDKKKQGLADNKIAALKGSRPKFMPNALNDREKILMSGVVLPKDVSVTLEDIGGLEEVKADLRSAVLEPLMWRDRYSSELLQPAGGILLYGAPGTGKTMLAKALAHEAKACFLLIQQSDLGSKWYGDSARLAAAVFSLALKLAPCIVFLDEVDSFLGIRRDTEHEATTGIKNEFMQLWDGFNTRAEQRVVVLGATNRPYAIDPAALRRFRVQREVGMPGHGARVRILRMNLKKHHKSGQSGHLGHSNKHPVAAELLGEDTPALREIAAATEGYSGSDLHELCVRAARLQVAEQASLVDTNNHDMAPSEVKMPELGKGMLHTAIKELHPAVASRRAIVPITAGRSTQHSSQLHAGLADISSQFQQLLAMMLQLPCDTAPPAVGMDESLADPAAAPAARSR